MADIPDFTVKTRQLDAGAVANVLQRKQEIENQQANYEQEQKNQRLQRILDAVQGGQQIAANMMNMAEKRQTLAANQSAMQGQQQLEGLLTTPPPAPPAPTAASSALPGAGTFPVQPSAEDTQNYANLSQKRQADLVSALIKANPSDVTKELAKSQFGPPEKGLAPDFQSKPFMVDGKPEELVFDPRTGGYLYANTREPVLGKIGPYNPQAGTDLTDDDRRRLGKVADAVVAGSATISAVVNARNADKAKLAQLVYEKDPNADLALYPQRVKTRNDFSSAGVTGKTLISASTVIGHMDTLDKKINALDNGGIVKLNSLGNWVSKNVGRPEVSGFLATKGLVNAEMAKIAQGSGVVSNEERQEFARALDAASSPAQAHEVISTWTDLIKSRVDTIESTWHQTMGDAKPPTPFLSPKAKDLLIKRGYDPKTMEKTGGTAAPAPFAIDKTALDAEMKRRGL